MPCKPLRQEQLGFTKRPMFYCRNVTECDYNHTQIKPGQKHVYVY